MPRRILLIVSILIGILLLGIFSLRFLLPNSIDISKLPGVLPTIISKVLGDKINTRISDSITKTITIPELVIEDENLTQAKQNITTIEHTITEMNTKLEETENKVKAYNDYKTLLAQGYTKDTTIKNPHNQTLSPYGQDFETELHNLNADIVRYTRLISLHEGIVNTLKKSIVYYYCNGYTIYDEGDIVDISRLAQDSILIHKSNGSQEEISCGWNGTPTYIPADSPYHPQVFFKQASFLYEQFLIEYRDIYNQFKNQPNPFQDIVFNYITEDNWKTMDHRNDPIVWKSAPPVWNYYLQVFLGIFVNLSLDFSFNISHYYTDYFTLYPIDDIARHQSVSIWFDRYLSYRYQNDFYITGRINTGTNTIPICADIRIGIPKGLQNPENADQNILLYGFDTINPVTIRRFPLVFEVTDENGTIHKEDCIVTQPGIWQVFRATVRNIDMKQPYLFDIIDKDFVSYRRDSVTNRVQLVPYRYFGPQPLITLDTLTPQFHLSYTPISTKDDKEASGLIDSSTNTYQTKWEPNTTDSNEDNPSGTLSLIFKALVHDERRTSVLSNPSALNTNISNMPCASSTTASVFPNIALVHYAETTNTVFSPKRITQTRVLSRPVHAGILTNNDNNKDNTFECTFVYAPISAHAHDVIHILNTTRETNLWGPMKVGEVGGM